MGKRIGAVVLARERGWSMDQEVDQEPMLKKRLEKSWRQGQGLVPVPMKEQKKSMVPGL